MFPYNATGDLEWWGDGLAITVGVDIAKQVFQVDGVDQDGSAVLRRKLVEQRYPGKSLPH